MCRRVGDDGWIERGVADQQSGREMCFHGVRE